MDLATLLTLALTGLAAGFVDAIAGGGGLIAIPVLVSLGFPPIPAFATNKVQSAAGTFIAAATYWRNGLIEFRVLWPAMSATALGALLGAATVKSIDTRVLEYAVPVALVLIALYFALAPRMTDADRRTRVSFQVFVPLVGFSVGFYDGLFGPGTGSFLTAAFVALFGLGVPRAVGNAKVLNLMSNLGALALFVPAGDVVWAAAAVMAAGQIVGGYLGARTGIRFGARLIRPLVVVVSIALAVRLLIFR